MLQTPPKVPLVLRRLCSSIRKPARERFAEVRKRWTRSGTEVGELTQAGNSGPAAGGTDVAEARYRSFIVSRFDEDLEMDRPSLIRLERIEIDGLFGLYDHRIDLNLKDRVTLLHGPNGVGKTTTLGMVDALLRRNMGYFGRLPFRRFLLRFEDETELALTADESGGTRRLAKLALERPDGQRELDVVRLVTDAESIAAGVEHLARSSDGDGWIDVRDGEFLRDREVVRRYGESDPGGEQAPPWLDEFSRSTNTHFIRAQRLVRTGIGDDTHRVFLSRHVPSLSQVVECSRDFQRRLGRTMADYGRQAQTLDQTFPQRLMSGDDLPPEDQEDLEQRMVGLERKTEEFKKIGILDETPTRPIEHLGEMDDTQRRVMALYVRDTEEKLGTLEDLASRTRTLLDNVNGKYRHKRIRLDREDGLVAEGEQGQRLPLDSLSSGEQHELVLHYDMLFRVRPNTVVLVDEPELSLHVEWQGMFLPELIEIVQLAGFDAIVATHSPFIVGERDDLMVGLGDLA